MAGELVHILSEVQSEQEQQNALGIQREAIVKPAKYLNLGCGRIILPAPRPEHHMLVPEGIYSYPEWENIDRNKSEGVDKVFDLFRYPWPLKSNTYGGALLSHICEHIEHEIHTRDDELYGGWDKDSAWSERIFELSEMQDSWYCFFSELYRVLKPGAMVHIISPHAYSTGAHFDPSHTRYLLPETFNHSMQPNPDAPFEYATSNLHFETRDVRPGVGPRFAHLVPTPSDSPQVAERKLAELYEAAETRINVITEFYVRLECVK